MKHIKSSSVFLTITLVIAPFLAKAQTSLDSATVDNIHMLTYTKTFSKHYQGWSIQYREFDGSTDEFVIPITLSFGSARIDQALLEKKDIASLDTYSLGLGFDGYERLGKGTYLNLGLGTIVGLESIETTKQQRIDRFLIGGTSKIGLLFVPFQELGLVFGANALGRLSNSRAVRYDLGLSLEVGVNF
ncbi:hypothetical protein [Tunicatimonas pelagia]|uniref:hypothetical protein n=1 Tax=Tunicatimonas pelagia TaxID=931531 RepID=UPI0026653117|nr:hypothetical protein [Tunicatimonas pelagia]WKN41165.1 hypothetical protein P0M28_19200 [Tunicatimonas pelagia]